MSRIVAAISSEVCCSPGRRASTASVEGTKVLLIVFHHLRSDESDQTVRAFFVMGAENGLRPREISWRLLELWVRRVRT